MTLFDALAAEFERWQLPDSIVFIDEVPKTATGTVDTKLLRAEFDDPASPWTPGESPDELS